MFETWLRLLLFLTAWKTTIFAQKKIFFFKTLQSGLENGAELNAK